MKLSKNFSLAEMLKSQTAERKGIPNDPTDEHIKCMKMLAKNILQPIRNEFGSFIVSSGYRSPELCIAIDRISTASMRRVRPPTSRLLVWITMILHCGYKRI